MRIEENVLCKRIYAEKVVCSSVKFKHVRDLQYTNVTIFDKQQGYLI